MIRVLFPPAKRGAGKTAPLPAGHCGGCGKAGLGDMVEALVKPIARALKLDCLDEHEQLKPGTPCWKRRETLNEAGRKMGIGRD